MQKVQRALVERIQRTLDNIVLVLCQYDTTKYYLISNEIRHIDHKVLNDLILLNFQSVHQLINIMDDLGDNDNTAIGIK